MFENYKLVFPGTNIHMITFAIIAFEIVILVYQLIFFLFRPSDKNRLWYLILLTMLIQYNIAGGLFPDPRLHISITAQNILAYGAGILMSIYFPFYIYKFLELKKLKFYAYYGSIYFLFLPFILTFVIPYLITGNLDLCRKLVVIVPFLYAVSFLYSVAKTIIKRKPDEYSQHFKEKVIGVSAALVFWIGGLSIVTFLKGEQIVEHSVTNTGFLIMTIIFVRSTIIDSRKDYQRLLKSENELQQANELLQIKVLERTKELEMANEQKINTFINLAHEIRTPITLINNYFEEYISKHDNSDELTIIKSNIEKLNSDIVNCFNEERFLKGLFPVYNHGQIICFSLLLSKKLLLFKKYAQSKNIGLIEKIDNNLYVEADPDAIDSIINNLIENSIKYTSKGGLVNVGLLSDRGSIRFSVKDNGCGIPVEMHEKIFEPYFQVYREKLKQQGMGMGLSIVNNIVKSLDGEIFINSKENEGTEFIVTIKQHHLAEGDNITNHNPQNPLGLGVFKQEIEDVTNDVKFPSILIIEDNCDMLRYLRNKLSEKYNVYVATSGRQALIKLKTIPIPNLIISDVMMEKMDGFEFLKAISDNPDYSYIPLIFLTAKTTSKDKLQGINLGAIDYISKPFSIKELSSKVESVINNAKKQKKAILRSTAGMILNQGDVILDSTDLPPGKTISQKDNFEHNCKVYQITPREKDIIDGITTGLAYKEIANKLSISEKTVKKHCENIFNKVEVSSKLEMIKKLHT